MANMFSIIIPVYNRENSISKAVSSVINQTYPFWNLIIVDDCSTDRTIEVITEFHDSRIRILKMKKNSGAASARNHGIKASSTNYISLLDSDDFLEPEFLEESLKTLENASPSTGFMWTGVRYIEGGFKKDFFWQPARKETPYLTFLHYLHIGTNSGITFKKEVFTTCGYFDYTLPAAEDTEFFLRISKQFDYTNNPNILINIERDSDDRLSKNFKKIAKAYNIFLPQHLPVINEYSGLRSKYYYKMMWLNYNISNKKEAREYFIKIPKNGIKNSIRPRLVKTIYELFPLSLAVKLHKKIATL